MPNIYRFGSWLLLTCLLLPAAPVRAQAPVITSIIPMANARAAARNAPVTVSFSQPLTAASAGALKVFSSQRGGLRTRGATPAVVSGNMLRFAPTAYDFRPGETVHYTVTAAAAGTSGALAQARVGQFTTAVGGTGSSTPFSSANILTLPVGGHPHNLAVGDVDGDGDLDLLTANDVQNGSIWVWTNTGRGIFTGSQSVAVGGVPRSVALGDVDGDGDLDLLAATPRDNSVSVRLNNNGVFSGTQQVSVDTNPQSVVVGDVDGDGDLDLFTANLGGSSVSVRLNNGSGTFTYGQDVVLGTAPNQVVVGDVDGDGDLDVLVANYYSMGTVSVRLNNGSGSFSGIQEVSTGSNVWGVAIGDIDGDGDLDFIASNANLTGPGTVHLRLNNGNGIFSGSQSISTGTNPGFMSLGDVDGDGDLDLLTANYDGNDASVRLNNGNGAFGNGSNVNVGQNPSGITLNDIDGDGDLDLLTTNETSATVSICLNGGTGPLATAATHPTAALALFPNPAHGAVALTGAAPYAPVTVFDALGRTILTATADANGTLQIALPERLPAGLYLVRSGGQVQQLVVE